MPLSNGPFHIFLSSGDRGLTLSWKVLDGPGRVHMQGCDPMPDFANGGGVMLTMHLEIADSEHLEKKLEELPVDPAIVEQRLGEKFIHALKGESSDAENDSD